LSFFFSLFPYFCPSDSIGSSACYFSVSGACYFSVSGRGRGPVFFNMYPYSSWRPRKEISQMNRSLLLLRIHSLP
jgi:hypothetical protein